MVLDRHGSPDHSYVDQGSAYISDEMKGNMATTDIHMDEAPIEGPVTIEVVKRYHALLRAAYNRIHLDISH